jgi:hypothetical protein
MSNGHAIYTARIRAGVTGIDIQGLELLNMSVTDCAAASYAGYMASISEITK